MPDGIAVAQWVCNTAKGLKAFYDIDTPVTLQLLKERRCEYISKALIPAFDLYLSFTGGPILQYLEKKLHSPCAKPLYCSVDPELYFPMAKSITNYDLGYLGTYSEDRQATLNELLLVPAVKIPDLQFAVAGRSMRNHKLA